MARQTDLLDLWRGIVQAGGVQAYITAQLTERGFLVARRETDGMADHELKAYKLALKAEAEEKRNLASESWRAYKANHVVHLGEGVHWSDDSRHDKWDVPNAEERAAENGLPPLDKPEQLAEALGLSVADLRWMTYHRDAATTLHYARFTIPKRDGTLRPIWAPLPKLKEAQRWILANIAERLQVHGAAHGFLAGRSILSNAAIHVDSRAILKMDLKDFFPTVTWRRVKGIFRKAGYREQIATLLALLCTEAPREIVEHAGKRFYVALGPRCLPQGAPTSPALTNVLCLRLDQRITGVATKLGWRYTRYADDLTFSLPAGHNDKPNLGRLIGLVHRIVQEEGFAVHPDKTRVTRRGGRQRVTGLVVNGPAPPRVPRSIRREVRAALHNLQKGKPLPEGETLSRLAGYAAYIHMTDPQLGAKLAAQLPQG